MQRTNLGTELSPDLGRKPSAPAPIEDPESGARTRAGWSRWFAWQRVRPVLSVVVLGIAAYFLSTRSSELAAAFRLVYRVEWRWIAIGAGAEAVSLLAFARLQRRLLQAGGITLSVHEMFEITLAGNALAMTLPGGVAWSATWVFDQLKRRGVDRFLRVWVFLVAGAVSSFSLFVVLACGALVAGDRGPVAGLRPLVVVLAAIPLIGVVIALVLHVSPIRNAGEWIHEHPGTKALGWAQRLIKRITAIHLGPMRWAEALALALFNWIADAGTLVTCMLALHIPVPWSAVLVVYGLTKVAAVLPFTPGGLGVVEGSLAALLGAYGLHTDQALATVIVYRSLSFWVPAPVGWGLWALLSWRSRRASSTMTSEASQRVPGEASR